MEPQLPLELISEGLCTTLESTEALISTPSFPTLKPTVMAAFPGGGRVVNSVMNAPPWEILVIFPEVVSPVCVTVQGMDTLQRRNWRLSLFIPLPPELLCLHKQLRCGKASTVNHREGWLGRAGVVESLICLNL